MTATIGNNAAPETTQAEIPRRTNSLRTCPHPCGSDQASLPRAFRDGAGIELNIRNEELANEANITVFTASRLLNEWQRQGILTKSRGKVVLRSPETLMSSEG